jgi:hypothetical protein
LSAAFRDRCRSSAMVDARVPGRRAESLKS